MGLALTDFPDVLGDLLGVEDIVKCVIIINYIML